LLQKQKETDYSYTSRNEKEKKKSTTPNKKEREKKQVTPKKGQGKKKYDYLNGVLLRKEEKGKKSRLLPGQSPCKGGGRAVKLSKGGKERDQQCNATKEKKKTLISVT